LHPAAGDVMNLRRSSIPLTLVPALLFLAAAFFYPLAFYLQKAFTDPVLGFQNFIAVGTDDLFWLVLRNTLVICGATTGLCLLLGYPYAYTLAISGRTLRRLLIFVILIPFWTSILVRSFAWMVLLQPKGLINATLLSLGLVSRPLELIFNRSGLLIGMVQIQLPFMIFPLYAVMSKIDPIYMSAAANLGASPLRRFFNVYAPLSMPGIFTGCMLVFATSLGYFIAPALLGGRRETMIAQVIHDDVADLGEWGVPAVLSFVLLFGTLLLFGSVRLAAGWSSRR
jgi:putative spermidine/putrescine transport system permease protein